MLIAIWDEDNEPHIAQHGLSRSEVESVLADADAYAVSRSSGRPMAFGRTPDGRFIAVIYDMLDEVHVYPVTAYEV